MRCTYKATGQTRDEKPELECVRCGHRRYTNTPPEKCARECSNPHSDPCAHLGDKIGTEPCESCRGTVRIKVFECALHGKATLGKKLDKIACCANCPDYAAPAANCCAIAKRDPDPDDGRSG